jgi:tripartite-type tricarboxylate transporter receptor subunit TctC
MRVVAGVRFWRPMAWRALANVLRQDAADPALQESYRSQGMEPDINSSPAKFQRLVEDELARLAPLIKSIGLKRD